MSRFPPAAHLWFAVLVACGARSPLEPDNESGGAGAGTAFGGDPNGGAPSALGGGAEGGGDSRGGGGGVVAVPQCLCANLPGYSPCILPLMCCPLRASCENPATYNCTGSQTLHCEGRSE